MILIPILAATLLMVCLRILKSRSAPFDRKELERYSRAAERDCKEWMHPFE